MTYYGFVMWKIEFLQVRVKCGSHPSCVTITWGAFTTPLTFGLALTGYQIGVCVGRAWASQG